MKIYFLQYQKMFYSAYINKTIFLSYFNKYSNFFYFNNNKNTYNMPYKKILIIYIFLNMKKRNNVNKIKIFTTTKSV